MILLDKHPKETTRNYCVRVVLHNIIHYNFTPGQKLSEGEIAKVLDTSRTPVREALIEISRRGLVEILPQSGSYVAKINLGIIEESYFLRNLIEKEIVTLACQGIEEVYIGKLRVCVEKLRNSDDDQTVQSRIDIDNEFHRIIFESVGRLWTFNVIFDHMPHYDRLRVKLLENEKDAISNEHEKILNAIISKDVERCSEMMCLHLARYREDVSELQKEHPEYFE